MNKPLGYVIGLIIFGSMVGLILWAYEISSKEVNRYSRAFEQNYRHGSRQPLSEEKTYHGTKESDIKKYQGNRYSTY